MLKVLFFNNKKIDLFILGITLAIVALYHVRK